MDILVLTQTSGILKPFAVVLGVIMDYIYKFLEMFGLGNVGATVVLFTLVVNVLMIPLTLKQQKYTKMSSLMNPEIQRIQQKYKNKKDERSVRMMQAETQSIYDKYGANPTGGCLPVLIQFPIMIVVYRVVYNVPAYVQPIKEMYMHIAEPIMNAANAGDVMGNLMSSLNITISNFDITNANTIVDALYKVKTNGWDAISDAFSAVPQVVDAVSQYSHQIISANALPFGMSITDAPITFGNGIAGFFPGIIIPILAYLTQWAQMKVSQRSQPKMDTSTQMGSTMNTMNIMMPLMSVFFTVTLPAGVGLYWIASAFFRTVIYLLIDMSYSKKNVDEIIEANKEKAAQKAEKRNQDLEKYATMNTRTIERKSIKELAGTSVEGKEYPKAQPKKNKPADTKSDADIKAKETDGKKKKDANKNVNISNIAHMLDKYDD